MFKELEEESARDKETLSNVMQGFRKGGRKW